MSCKNPGLRVQTGTGRERRLFLLQGDVLLEPFGHVADVAFFLYGADPDVVLLAGLEFLDGDGVLLGTDGFCDHVFCEFLVRADLNDKLANFLLVLLLQLRPGELDCLGSGSSGLQLLELEVHLLLDDLGISGPALLSLFALLT